MDSVVQRRRSFTVYLALACFPGALLFVSCGKQESNSTAQSSATNSPASATIAASPTVAGPGPDEKACFQCNSTGMVACRAPGCKAGNTDCPGGCLKLSRGVWTHMNVAGHSPSDLWISFKTANGGTSSWNQNHVGEVIAYQNGNPVSLGPCKTCGGTTIVTCSACKGRGTQTCEICSGKKFVPIAWTPTDNPWFNRQPDLIRLKDGQVILGRVAASIGDEKTIITRDKKVLHVRASDILPKSAANSSGARATSPK